MKLLTLERKKRDRLLGKVEMTDREVGPMEKFYWHETSIPVLKMSLVDNDGFILYMIKIVLIWKKIHQILKRALETMVRQNCCQVRKNVEILFASRMVALQPSQPIIFSPSFVFRSRLNKEPVPVQSLRDLMQEEEQKTNVPTSTPRIPIASGKSGSARKKLKYSRCLIHTTSKKCENADLFLRLGPPYTLIRHENGAVKRS